MVFKVNSWQCTNVFTVLVHCFTVTIWLITFLQQHSGQYTNVFTVIAYAFLQLNTQLRM